MMSDTSVLDVPSEVDPVEEADKLIEEHRMREGWIDAEVSILLRALVSLREHLRDEHGY
jgi:hypothetical protein